MKNTTLILCFSLILYGCLCLFRLGDFLVCMPHESGLCAWVVTVARNYGAAGMLDELRLIFFGMDSMREPFVGNANLAMNFAVCFFAGASLWSVRVAYVLCSFVSLLSVFYVLRRWFDDWVGAIAVLLLAVDPVFIVFTRVGAERDEIIQICLFWTGLMFIELSVSRQRKIFFYLSGFCFGLALWAKMLFLGYLFGVVVLLICAGARNRRLVIARYNLCVRDFIVWALFWCAGMLPLLLYNLFPVPRFETLRVLWGALVNQSLYGRNNLDLVHNIGQRFVHLWHIIMELGAMKGLVFLFPFVVVSVGWILCAERRFNRKALSAILVVYGVCFFLSSFVPTSAYFEQLLILWPIVQILLAVSFRNAWLMVSGKAWRILIVFVFAVSCSSLAACTVGRIHSGLQNKSGGGLRNLARAVIHVQEFLGSCPESLDVAFMSDYVFEAAYVCAGDRLKDRIYILKKKITEPTLLVLSSSALGWSYETYLHLLNLGANESELLYFYNDIEFDMKFYVFRIAPRKIS